MQNVKIEKRQQRQIHFQTQIMVEQREENVFEEEEEGEVMSIKHVVIISKTCANKNQRLPLLNVNTHAHTRDQSYRNIDRDELGTMCNVVRVVLTATVRCSACCFHMTYCVCVCVFVVFLLLLFSTS